MTCDTWRYRMSNLVSIHPAQRAHLDTIRSINVESTPGVAALTPNDLIDVFESASLIWVAMTHEQVEGYLIGFAHDAAYQGEEFVWFRSRVQDFIYIDQIAVAADSRRRGVAAALYQALETFAAARRLAALTCEVNLEPPNSGSMAFHRRQGFSEIDRLRTADGRHVALMRKHIHG
jgi:uncharacterized protein